MTYPPTLDDPRVSTVMYCIGAQKAATSWLYKTLSAHPECHLAPTKEVRFWDTARLPEGNPAAARFAQRDLENARRDLTSAMLRFNPRNILSSARRYADARQYRALIRDPDTAAYLRFMMRGYRGQRLVGELTAKYSLLDAQTFAEMAATHPNARFVFIMRDPADRLWSGIRHNHKLRARNAGRAVSDDEIIADFAQASADVTSLPRRLSDYNRTIEALEQAVPRDRILYLFYETLFEPAALRQLETFFGLSQITANTAARPNAGIKPDLRPDAAAMRAARNSMAEIYDYVSARFTDIPANWRGPTDITRERSA